MVHCANPTAAASAQANSAPPLTRLHAAGVCTMSHRQCKCTGKYLTYHAAPNSQVVCNRISVVKIIVISVQCEYMHSLSTISSSSICEVGKVLQGHSRRLRLAHPVQHRSGQPPLQAPLQPPLQSLHTDRAPK